MAASSFTKSFGLLRVEKNAALSVIWTLDTAQFFDRSTFYSVPFTLRDESFQLGIHKTQRKSPDQVCLSVTTTDQSRSYFLRCSLETKAGNNLSRESLKSDHLECCYDFYWSHDELRSCFGDSRVVRLVITFFPERPNVVLERPNVRSQLKVEKCRGELRQVTKPGVTAVWTVTIPRIRQCKLRQSALFHLGDDSFRLTILDCCLSSTNHPSCFHVGLLIFGRGKEESAIFSQLTLQTRDEETVIRTFAKRFEFRGDSLVDCLRIELSEFCQLFQVNDRTMILRIVCSLFRDDECTRTVRDRNGLSRDFRELFLTGQGSDITIEVEDTEFQGHKAILISRCPFLANALKYDMVEKNNGVVKIPHYSAKVFKDFLLYLYSGQIDAFTTEKALSLYRAAHEYRVPNLKADCLEVLRMRLAVDTLGDVIDLSLMYDEKDLLKLAKLFFTLNFKDVINTESWGNLLKKNFKEVNEMLETINPKSKRRKVSFCEPVAVFYKRFSLNRKNK